ncbi:MAG: hypothetical protein JNJ46_31060 [Myxococcales bacterium]|nr:hypothetical protein [Myxococcales bacterium]
MTGNISRPLHLLWLGICLSSCLLSLSARADEVWEPVTVKGENREGISVEKRSVPGSKFMEYRARAVTSVSPEVVLRGLWSGLTEPSQGTVKKREILRKSETELVFYDQVKTPVVSDRDYTMRIWQSKDEKTGALHVRFETANELGPPVASGFVRIPKVRGSWLIEAGEGGGAKLTYQCYSEPGGSIPAFMVRGAQQNQVVVDMRRILERAQRAASAAK